MGRINQALRPPEDIELANSLIDGTEHQKNLLQGKKKHLPHHDEEAARRVGLGFYKKFLKYFTKSRMSWLKSLKKLLDKLKKTKLLYETTFNLSWVQQKSSKVLAQPLPISHN